MTNYRLQSHETLPAGVWRIASELTDEALAHLELPDRPDEGIHEARKVCKKARGLARLVRPGLENYKEVNGGFRDAARQLAPIRDPQAFLGTFDDLVSTPASTDELESIRPHFERAAAEARERIKGPESHRLEESRELVRGGLIDVNAWKLDDDFSSVGAGVHKTYKRGRKAMHEAAATRRPEDFHEWRKRTKYLWYQIRLLRNSAPSILRPFASRLHDVSDSLGDAHDLVLMREEVAAFDTDDAAKEAFRVVASGFIRELEDRALSLGRRLLAESPPAFVDRLENYWEAWQAGDELEAGEIADITTTSDSPIRSAAMA